MTKKISTNYIIVVLALALQTLVYSCGQSNQNRIDEKSSNIEKGDTLAAKQIKQEKEEQLIYKTVNINGQKWMAENLKVDKFRNGEIIPEAKTLDEWNKFYKRQQPAWCYYNGDKNFGEPLGKIYNFFAVIDPRILAPVGYDIPTSGDWNDLSDFLEHNSKQIRSKSNWKDEPMTTSQIEGNGTDDFGMSVHPFGSCNSAYFCSGFGTGTSFWCKASPNGKPMSVGINHWDEIKVSTSFESSGCYIRCIQY
jgi:uncharacterized protein (TIGR02145 family)